LGLCLHPGTSRKKVGHPPTDGVQILNAGVRRAPRISNIKAENSSPRMALSSRSLMPSGPFRRMGDAMGEGMVGKTALHSPRARPPRDAMTAPERVAL